MGTAILLKNSALYLFSTLSITVGNFAVIPFLTHALTPREYAYIANFHVWCALITVIASMNLNIVLQRDFIINSRHAHLQKYLLSDSLRIIYNHGFILTFALLIVLMFDWEILYIYIVFGGVLYSLHQIILSYLIVQEHAFLVFLSGLIIGVLTPLSTIILVEELDAQGRVLSLLSVVTFCLFFLYVCIYQNNKDMFKLSSYGTVNYREGLSLYPHSISNYLLSQGDRAIFALVAPMQGFGVYFLASQLFQVIFICYDAVNKAFHIWMLRKLNDRCYRSFVQIIRYFLFLYLISILMLFLASNVYDFLLPYLIEPAFYSYKAILDVMLISFFLIPITFLFQNYLTYLGAYKIISLISMYSAAIWIVTLVPILYFGQYDVIPYLVPFSHIVKIGISSFFIFSHDKSRDYLRGIYNENSET